MAGLLCSQRTALPGAPHIAGVITTGAEKIEPDLVVDASGRRSALSRSSVDQGVRPVGEKSGEAGLHSCPRYFAGRLPRPRTDLLCPDGSISVLTPPADGATWSVTVFVFAADAPPRAIRRPAVWLRVVPACPLHGHRLDGEPPCWRCGVLGHLRGFGVGGEPLAAVLAMWGARTPSGLRCRRRTGGHRRPGGGGRAAGTNPSLGRGVSPGLRHVAELAAVVCAHLDAPAELSRAWLELTESRLAP